MKLNRGQYFSRPSTGAALCSPALPTLSASSSVVDNGGSKVARPSYARFHSLSLFLSLSFALLAFHGHTHHTYFTSK